MTQAPATPELVERLSGPHEWGYRCPVEGAWIEDLSPFEAAVALEAKDKLANLLSEKLERRTHALEAAQALADRYEKALDVALDVAIGQERRLIEYGKPANELAWLIEQIRQALSSSQGRHEGGEDGLPESPCGVGPSDLTDPQSQHSDGGPDGAA